MVRLFTRSTQATIDLVVLSLAFWLAFFLRFEFAITSGTLKQVMLLWPWAVVFQYCVLVLFGVPRFSWRYIGLREANIIFLALLVSALGLLIARIMSPMLSGYMYSLRHLAIPLGVIAINFALNFMGVAGVRVLRRMLGERMVIENRHRDRAGMENSCQVPTLLIGAGDAGVMVAKEINQWPGLNIRPVGFLDDDPFKKGTEIHGIRVIGTTDECARIARETGAEQVLITIANAPRSAIRRIHDICTESGIKTKIIPGVYEIIGDRVRLDRIRPVVIEDLLGREPVSLEEEVVSASINGRTVIVTGAGGSIGSELCRQIIRFSPKRLVLVDQAESVLFEIHRELCLDSADKMIPCIADVTDRMRMRWIMSEYRPDIIFHAAAHKHVPMMELNPGEAVKNNVLGTGVVADLADEIGAERFVLVSTDKAVNPSSVMGATKRIAEIYIQCMSRRSRTKYTAVRFGNVLGSVGSVVPIFREQIARGGPVTITHPEMKRYFMTIPESCQLVMQAGAMGDGGEVFILDMGEPVKIIDLARDMIRLSGLEPDEDIKIEYSGTRPGEKLFEELSVDDESADRTRHPKIFVGRIRTCPWQEVQQGIIALADIRDSGDKDTVLERIGALVPEFQQKARKKDASKADDSPTLKPVNGSDESEGAAPVIFSLGKRKTGEHFRLKEKNVKRVTG